MIPLKHEPTTEGSVQYVSRMILDFLLQCYAMIRFDSRAQTLARAVRLQCSAASVHPWEQSRVP